MKDIDKKVRRFKEDWKIWRKIVVDRMKEGMNWDILRIIIAKREERKNWDFYYRKKNN